MAPNTCRKFNCVQRSGWRSIFLIESVRAGGAVIVSAIVGLAAYLAFTAPNPTQARGQSVSVLMAASAIAIAVGIAGFAVAVVLLGVTGF